MENGEVVITSAEALFNVVIETTAASIHAGLATPFLIAVEITPVPKGLVSSRRSPDFAPPLFSTRSGFYSLRRRRLVRPRLKLGGRVPGLIPKARCRPPPD